MSNGLGPGFAIDIFCRVIDHSGDAGVAWRLCRALRSELPAARLRLVIDDLTTLAALVPRVVASRHRQTVQGIEIMSADALLPWLAAGGQPAPLVLDTFGCDLPPAYFSACATATTLILNLEYITAEAWARDYHGRESLLPMTGPRKFFFMPGVDPAGGGILGVTRPIYGAAAARQRARLRLLRGFRLQPELAQALWVPVYLYARRLDALLASFAALQRPVLLLAMGAPVQAELRRLMTGWRALAHPGAGELLTHGGVHAWLCPFFPQALFDRVLAASDLALVRGEDSFAGALLTGRPFLWQLYPQTGGYQRVKLEALLAALAGIWSHDRLRLLFDRAQLVFNFPAGDEEALWGEWLAALPDLGRDLGAYAPRLRETCNLSEKMLQFITPFFRGI
jgi:uncharacterized repeat protein (TIGR03837 family)